MYFNNYTMHRVTKPVLIFLLEYLITLFLATSVFWDLITSHIIFVLNDLVTLFLPTSVFYLSQYFFSMT